MEIAVVKNALLAASRADPSGRLTAIEFTGPTQVFQAVKKIVSEDLVEQVQRVFQFNITGSEANTWYLDLKNGSGSVSNVEPPGGVDCSLTLDSAIFTEIFNGKMNARNAHNSGKVIVKGNRYQVPMLLEVRKRTFKAMM